MEDDEEFPTSNGSPPTIDVLSDDNDNDKDEQDFGSPRSASPDPNTGRITVTLALPIQNHRSTPPSSSVAATSSAIVVSGAGGGGGREDCWSEEGTAALIEAWGERYSEQARGILKQKHWEEVAEFVNARGGAGIGKPPRTDVQCKNRMDTVKRKYKSEKAKIASGSGPSTWIFFERLDRLLGSLHSASAKKPQPNHGFHLRAKRPVTLVEDSDSGSSDSLPPSIRLVPRTVKRQKTAEFDSPPPPLPRPPRFGFSDRTGGGEREGRSNEWRNSIMELTRVIFMFSEAYEQAESEKLQQMVEMEKQRMKFAKELEIQRMKFLMKTQLQLSRLSRVGRHAEDDENNNVDNNNSDSSN